MHKINFAIIGVGSMGKNHARVLSEIPEVNLVAVVDNDISLAQEIAEKYKIQAFNTLEQMFQNIKVSAACICVPTTAHLAIGKACLQNGIDILVEKPIAATIAEAEELLHLAQKHNRNLMVGHIERYNPAFMRVKQLVDSGEIGKVVSVHTRRVGVYPPRIRDVNIAVDLAIHDIDLVNYLLGKTPQKISSSKRRNHLKYREDSVEIFMQFEEASAVIQANWITPIRVRNMFITGSEGYLEMDFLTQKISLYKSKIDKTLENNNDHQSEIVVIFSETTKTEVEVEKFESLKKEINYFISAINGNMKINSTHALDALKIALAC